ncbi:MAG: aminoacyl-tRNA hydrolase [Bacteroidetes bacterium]|nr:aminoacyl-tRNA hydrolase [Bacteroidota bacterium]
MKYLIVGLGNIGPEYHETRHNVGFMILDKLAEKKELTFKVDRLASVAEFKHKGRSITLIKPTTYMNLSGKALNYWMSQLKIPIENVLTIVDDLALPVGKLRLKAQGSSAGHNGLKNIEEILGNNVYPRLKVGIGSDFPKGRQVDYVLGKFLIDERIEIDLKTEKAIDMILSFCTQGITPTMNFYNE